MNTPLLERNLNGVTVGEAITVWKVGEAALCKETENVQEELAQHDQDLTLDKVWDKLSEDAQKAISDAWAADYENGTR